MNAPISRDELEGHKLYAPRRVRERLSDPTALRLRPQAHKKDQPHDAGGDPWYERFQAADAQPDSGGALWEVSDVDPTAFAELEARSMSTLPPQGEIGHPISSLNLWRRDRGAATATARARGPLDPDIVPVPPIEGRRRGSFGLLARFGLMIGFSAIIAYGFTMMSSSKPDDGWLQRAGGGIAAFGPKFRAGEPQPQLQEYSRLLANDQQTFVNDPLRLGVAVAHEKGNESLLLDGLAEGTRLSAGAPIGKSGWQLASNDLRGLYLYAPRDFVGEMNTAVALLAPDKRLLDSRAVRLKWVAKEPVPPSPPPPPSASDRVASAEPVAPAVQRVDPAEVAVLMSRAMDFLKAGDIEAARIGFSRLADANIANGVVALASTYDPRYLAEHNVFGVRGDVAKARALYQRAAELGSAEAGRILARMVTK